MYNDVSRFWVSGNAMNGTARQYLFFPEDTFNDVFRIPDAPKIKDVVNLVWDEKQKKTKT